MSWTDTENAEFYTDFRKRHPWFFQTEEQSELTEYTGESSEAEA
jgi:hypothetical protein